MSLFEWLFLACDMQSGSVADECEFMSFEGKSNKLGLENNAVIDIYKCVLLGCFWILNPIPCL